MMRLIGIFSQAGKTFFQDTFNRINQSGIGIASDGSIWTILRGIFSISSNSAISTDSPSTYPLASVTMSIKDVSVDVVSSSNGVIAALWITDSGNWWGVQKDYYETSYTYYYSCNCGQSCGTCCSTCYDTCVFGSTWGCLGYYALGGCAAYGSIPTTGPCNAHSCNCTTCNCSYGCDSCPGTGYTPHYGIKLIQSIANTISTISSTAVSVAFAAFRAKTSGTSVTVSTYLDSGLTSKIDSDIIYNTNALTTSKFGMSIGPSSSQGNSIDSITISKN